MAVNELPIDSLPVVVVAGDWRGVLEVSSDPLRCCTEDQQGDDQTHLRRRDRPLFIIVTYTYIELLYELIN